MQFSRLRLTGFKSFVDPTELVIEPGLTGIVGPNGCGKSNLVEALRWAMGESSAKQMRGGAMDDVIFAGTAARPSRNLAEVVIHLDNSERDAPPAHNDSTQIDVARRIERDAGSQYRINGKDARARDVQLLFADSATGARSTAIVGQGQIGAVISAKPDQRRHLLEEAAGITGLHSRRHEAELRLRAAEANLDRLDDVLAALQAQLQGLKRQARQAARYRSLSGRVRRAEARLLYCRWAAAEAAVAEAETRLGEVNAGVTGHTAQAAAAATAQADAAAGLPALRRAEAEAGAVVHRLAVERERLDEEEQRIADAHAALAAQAEQIRADIARENGVRDQARAAGARLAEETRTLHSARAGESEAMAEAEDAVRAARDAVEESESTVAALTDRVAATEAERSALERRLAEVMDRMARLDDRLGTVTAERAALEARAGSTSEIGRAEAAAAQAQPIAAACRATLEAAERDAKAAEGRRDADEEAERGARAALDRAEAQRARIAAEEEALAALVDSGTEGSDSATAPAIMDRITVAPGYEIALGAALGDDLAASTDNDAPARWRVLARSGETVPLPAEAVPLAGFVEAPPELSRRLAQIGVIDGAAGPRLQAGLAQGQRLVSRDGALWRWDGFARSADAPGAAAIRLRQRNRLAELRARITGAVDAVTEASRRLEGMRSALAESQATTRAARDAEARARADSRAADQALATARDGEAAALSAAASDRSRLAALGQAAAQLDADRAEMALEADRAKAGLGALDAPEAVRAPLEDQRADLAARRAELDRRRPALEALGHEALTRRQRLAAIETESAAWRRQDQSAERQLESLAAREAAVARESAALSARPEKIAARRQSLLDRSETAEAARRAAADELADAEARSGAADMALRAANETLAATREDLARAEGKLEQARSLHDMEAVRIRERLECEPDQALAVAGFDGPDSVPDSELLERQLGRLLRERENMGAVNLRAEEESAELLGQIETLEQERGDLVAAIARLRGGIASLNREGRQRLVEAFEAVNGHFKALFVRLFGGGRAHLSLIGDDDPLEAGLEIMASPPGKRMQVLSLLSGGEKALAALALLFAMFLTKPAPICVLDEVDAPLDDANVDRFCTLVEEIAGSASTRFLVITHHRLTMARMDRLFGVTMSERGVSQLVSVDLGGGQNLKAAE
ncbi:MAG: chromosome segregation protein SMC [Alphaproteobacteria bacterium]|nr:chromosome segregation protein SMC [Alphaproteobacteria bacterium]MDP6517509.1 chromosome segregation protein SMC [Alphaproteobacteria bacterium]